MRRSAKKVLVVALGAASAAVAACSAIVGVEDVHLAITRDGATGEDAPFLEDDAGDGSVTYEASVQLAAGYNHTCARELSGHVRCWGSNGGGEIGDGIPYEAGTRASVLVPQDVIGITDAISVAAGVSHACVVHRTGKVSCWGINSFGQLGNATEDRSSSPVEVIGIDNAVAVACGTSFSCALLSDTSVSCWGSNYAGQLGDGTKIDRSTASAVTGLSGVTGLAAAETHACALLTGGSVKCWGDNTYGQLGNGSTVASLSPTPLGSLSNIVQVVAAARFTCARAASGQVSCWGTNVDGELGTGATNGSPNPSPAITSVTDAIAIWVGYSHACAVRRSGDVECWGDNTYGQIGSGSLPGDAAVPKPTAVVGLSGAVDLSTGGDHSCATTRTGGVFCWGINSLGQLGNGTTEDAYAAVPTKTFP